MNKYSFFLLVVLLSGLLAACGSGLSEDDAEKGLRAGFKGDRNEAEKYICEKELADMSANSDRFSDIGVEVSCSEANDQMTCAITFSGENFPEGGEVFTVTGDVEEGKLCNIETSP